jgi:hypothetical protein
MARWWVRWLVVVVGGTATFFGCLLLATSFQGSFWPTNETDRWAVSAGFAASVSAAMIAALGWWASHPTVRFLDRASAKKGTTPVRREDSSSLLTNAFRAAALVVSTGVSIVIFLEVTPDILLWTNLVTVNIVAVALAVITLYLAHIAGSRLRNAQPQPPGRMRIFQLGRIFQVGGLCVLSWGLIGYASIWSRATISSNPDCMNVDVSGSVPCQTDTAAESIFWSVLYLAVGLIAAIGPAVPQRGSPKAQNPSLSAGPAG